MPENPASAPLGNIARIVSPGRVAERFYLQSVARKLLRAERVSKCLRALVPVARPGVDVYRSPEQHVHWSGLQRCASVWVCAVCAARITEARKQELDAAVRYAESVGLAVYLRTLTFRHSRKDSLVSLLDAFQDARRMMAMGRSGQPYASRVFGVVGSVTALEVTYGAASGWHPHSHSLVFVPQESSASEFEAYERERWEHVARRVGLSMNEHGYKLQPTYDAVAAYVSKMGEGDHSWWTVGAELSKAHVKKSRAGNLRVSPFGLLALADEDPAYAARFVEYSRAFKGKHQIQWSRGLRELLRQQDAKTDDELVRERREDMEWLARVEAEQWRRILAHDARAEFWEVCRTYDADSLLAWIDAL